MEDTRYSRNMPMLSAEENEQLKTFKVCVVGAGGLGGYLIEMLGRLGIGQITVVDGDIFDSSNLNRQLLADSDSLGQNKALAAAKRMQKVNPLIKVNAVAEMLDAENGAAILTGHDLLIDALDNAKTRFLLQDLARDLDIPMIHGAIAGNYGKITTIFPGDDSLDKLYKRDKPANLTQNLGTPSYTPAIVAGIEVSEAVKVLLGKGEPLRHKMLYFNLQTNFFQLIDY